MIRGNRGLPLLPCLHPLPGSGFERMSLFAMTAIDPSRFRRLTKEGSWIVIGQIAAIAGALVLVCVLTEYLGPEQYGQLALGLVIAGLVNQVVMGGITSGIGRFYSIVADDLSGFLNASRGLMAYATLAVGCVVLALILRLILFGPGRWLGLAAAVLVWFFYTEWLQRCPQRYSECCTTASHCGSSCRHGCLVKNRSSHYQPATTVADGIQRFVAWPRDYYKVKS